MSSTLGIDFLGGRSHIPGATPVLVPPACAWRRLGRRVGERQGPERAAISLPGHGWWFPVGDASPLPPAGPVFFGLGGAAGLVRQTLTEAVTPSGRRDSISPWVRQWAIHSPRPPGTSAC